MMVIDARTPKGQELDQQRGVHEGIKDLDEQVTGLLRRIVDLAEQAPIGSALQQLLHDQAHELLNFTSFQAARRFELELALAKQRT